MKVEKIKILAGDLGLEDDVNELIRVYKYTTGEMAYTTRGKASDFKKYNSQFLAISDKIKTRLRVVLPEFSENYWSFGRLSDNSCYITVWNPDWR